MGVGALIGAIVGGAAYTAGITLFGTTLFYSVLTGAALGYSLFDQRLERTSPTYDFGPLQNTRSQLLPVPVTYGRNKVAGNIIYQSEPGSAIKMLVGLGEGEIQAVTDIRANDIPIGDVKDATHAIYTGTGTQNPDPRNENAEALRHTAYIACTFTANDQISGSAPTITAIVEGLKVDVWNGSAWVRQYSRNPAYCLLDFLISTRYGLGIPLDRIDRESFKAVAAYCDELVDGETRFQLDLVIDSQQEGPDVLSEILATFGGFLTYSEGVIRLRVERSEVPVQAFTMDNIVEGSFSYGRAKRKDVPNRIVVEFVDPEAPEGAWERSEIVAEDEADMDLTGEVRERVIQLWGVTRHTQAGRVAKFYLDSARLCSTFCEFRVGIGALACEVGDIVKVSHDVPGWNEKLFRVLSIEEDENDEMKLSCREYNAGIYHDRGVPYTPPAAPALPNPFAPPPHVADLTGQDSVTWLGDGTCIPGIKLTWTRPGSMSRHHADVYLSTDNGATWNLVGSTSGSAYEIKPCEIRTYKCRVVSVSDRNVQANFAAAPTIDVLVRGDIQAPPAPTGLAVVTGPGKVARLSWAASEAADVKEYQVWRKAGSTPSDPTGATMVAEVSGLVYVDTTGNGGAAYTWFVKAVDSSENVSGFSQGVPATVPAEVDTTPPASLAGITLSSGGLTRYQDSQGNWFGQLTLNLQNVPSDSNRAYIQVKYRRQGAATYLLADQLTIASGNTSAVIGGLVLGMTYDFAAVPVSYYGIAGTGRTASISVTGDSTAPAAPVGLTVVTGPGKVARLSWTPPADTDVAKYEIWRKTGSTPSDPTGATKIADEAGTTHVDTTGDYGFTYTWFAKAVDRTGNVSGFSTGVAGTVPQTSPDTTVPSSLAGITLIVGSDFTYQDAEGATRVRVTVSMSSVPSDGTRAFIQIKHRRQESTEYHLDDQVVVSSGSKSIMVDDLLPGVAYEFAAAPVSHFGVQGTAKIASYTTGRDTTAPAAPTGLSIATGPGEVARLTWNAPADPDLAGYEIWRKEGNAPADPTGAVKIATEAGEVHIDTTGQPNGTYTWFVKAVDLTGNVSGFSGGAAATLPEIETWPDTTPPDSLAGIALAVGGDVLYQDSQGNWFVRVTLTLGSIPADTKRAFIQVKHKQQGSSQYRLDDQLAVASGNTTATVDDLLPGVTYDFAAVPVSHYGIQGTGKTAQHTNIGDNTAPAAPAGLAASFTGPDAVFSWEPSTAGDFKRSKVEIYVGGVKERTEYTAGSGYAYTYDKNLGDNGTASPSVIARVYHEDAGGNVSSYAEAVATNSAPPVPTGFVMTSALSQIQMDVNPCTATDFDRVEFELALQADYSDAQVAYSGSVFQGISVPAIGSGTHHGRVRFRDRFGQYSSYTTGSTDAVPISRADMQGSIFQIAPSSAPTPASGSLEQLWDMDTTTGPTFNAAPTVTFEFPIVWLFDLVRFYPSAAANYHVEAWSEASQAWVDVAGTAASPKAAAPNAWNVTRFDNNKMVATRKLRIIFDASLTLYELKFWTATLADEILAQTLRLTSGMYLSAMDGQQWWDHTGLNMKNSGVSNIMMNLNHERLGFWDPDGLPTIGLGAVQDMAQQLGLNGFLYGLLIAQGIIVAHQGVLGDALTDYSTTRKKIEDNSIAMEHLEAGSVTIGALSDVLSVTIPDRFQRFEYSENTDSNRLTNPGFETGSLAGWTGSGTMDSTIKHSGSYSVKNMNIYQQLPAQPGQTWKATGYSRAQGSSVYRYLDLIFLNAAQTVLQTLTASKTGTATEWNFQEVVGVAPANTAYVRIRARMSGTYDGWFDDMSLYGPGLSTSYLTFMSETIPREEACEQLRIIHILNNPSGSTVTVKGIVNGETKYEIPSTVASPTITVDLDVRAFSGDLSVMIQAKTSAAYAAWVSCELMQNQRLPLRGAAPKYAVTNAVQSSCSSTCERSCQATCQTSCQASCQTSCQTSCQLTCQTACQSSCQSTCETTSQSGGCFVEGTLVAVYDPETEEVRDVPIETLQAGMLMPAYNPVTDNVEITECIGNAKSKTGTLFLVEIEGGHVLRVTGEQPFDVLKPNKLTGELGWRTVQARYLEPGDTLIRPFDQTNRTPRILAVIETLVPATWVWNPKTASRRYIAEGFADAIIKE